MPGLSFAACVCSRIGGFQCVCMCLKSVFCFLRLYICLCDNTMLPAPFPSAVPGSSTWAFLLFQKHVDGGGGEESPLMGGGQGVPSPSGTCSFPRPSSLPWPLPGIGPASPMLVGRFFTTEPPRKRSDVITELIKDCGLKPGVY